MKKVFEHPEFHVVGLAQAILRSHGVTSEIRNEQSSGLMGEVPFDLVFPELWVVEDKQFEQAQALLKTHLHGENATEELAAWRCSRCGAEVPPTFAVCWQCGSGTDSSEEGELEEWAGERESRETASDVSHGRVRGGHSLRNSTLGAWWLLLIGGGIAVLIAYWWQKR